jgi:hypothetical protein
MLLQIIFVAVVLSIISALLLFAFSADRMLGWITVASIVGYSAAGVAMGLYLGHVRGRSYLAPDEIAFLQEGRAILDGWMTGQPHVRAIPGLYPVWNAIVIAVWGDSMPVLRFVNAIVGAIGVVSAFVLSDMFFGLLGARICALAVMVSPSLVLGSMLNLKERALGTAVTIAAIAAVEVLRRPSIHRSRSQRR